MMTVLTLFEQRGISLDSTDDPGNFMDKVMSNEFILGLVPGIGNTIKTLRTLWTSYKAVVDLRKQAGDHIDKMQSVLDTGKKTLRTIETAMDVVAYGAPATGFGTIPGMTGGPVTPTPAMMEAQAATSAARAWIDAAEDALNVAEKQLATIDSTLVKIRTSISSYVSSVINSIGSMVINTDAASNASPVTTIETPNAAAAQARLESVITSEITDITKTAQKIMSNSLSSL